MEGHCKTADGYHEVLLLEDDVRLGREIALALAAEGSSVRHLTAIDAFASTAREGRASLLVLDRMIGKTDSLGIVNELRSEGIGTPVIVVSSLSSVDERVAGLRAGGDDYVVKPFAMAELVARVDALRRRSEEGRRVTLVVGPLVLDTVGRTARRGARTIELVPRECLLLEYLMRHAGRIVSRSMLLSDVWHFNAAARTNVVEVHLSKLRRKVDLEGEAPLITSIRGLGYKLADPVDP